MDTETDSSARAPRRAHMQDVQNVLLIWMDNDIDEQSTNFRENMTELKRVINTIGTFIDANQCIEYLQSITNNKACMIISDSL
jgi:hypothetical protein